MNASFKTILSLISRGGIKMENNCEFCNIELQDDNESAIFPGVCKVCFEKVPLINDEILPLNS
jgi:hypothetical protein